MHSTRRQTKLAAHVVLRSLPDDSIVEDQDVPCGTFASELVYCVLLVCSLVAAVNHGTNRSTIHAMTTCMEQ